MDIADVFILVPSAKINSGIYKGLYEKFEVLDTSNVLLVLFKTNESLEN